MSRLMTPHSMFAQDVHDLLRSEADCRSSVRFVQRDAFSSLVRRMVVQLEVAWRQQFEVCLFQFHRAASARFESLRGAHEEEEQHQYRTFVLWAETASTWFDCLWGEFEVSVNTLFGVSCAQWREAWTRNALMVNERANRAVQEYLLLQSVRWQTAVELHQSFVAAACGASRTVSAQNALFYHWKEAGNRLWIGYAIQTKQLLWFRDVLSVSELELIRYRWALLFRLEQAGRRHIVYLSLLFACALVESWERLYILQQYAHRTGELVWWNQEQACILVVNKEWKDRVQLCWEHERFRRRQLLDWLFVVEISGLGKRALVELKEMVSRSLLVRVLESQHHALLDSLIASALHRRMLEREHLHQLWLLQEGESQARNALQSFLLLQHALDASQWKDASLKQLRDRMATVAMVPFVATSDVYVHGDAMDGLRWQGASDSAWQDTYRTPHIPRSAPEEYTPLDLATSGGATAVVFPSRTPRGPKPAVPPQQQQPASSPSPVSVAGSTLQRNTRTPQRQLVSSAAHGPSWERSKPEEFVLSISASAKAERETRDGSGSSNSNDSETDEGEMMFPVPPAPFFASGASPSTALRVVATIFDEERARHFLQGEGLRTQLVLLLSSGVPLFEEAGRLTIYAGALEVLRRVGRQFRFAVMCTATLEQEVRQRGRVLHEAVLSRACITSSFKLSCEESGRRTEMRTRLLNERHNLFAEYLVARHSDFLKGHSDQYHKQVHALRNMLEDALLREQVRQQHSLLRPTLATLHRAGEVLEEQISAEQPRTRWYDGIGTVVDEQVLMDLFRDETDDSAFGGMMPLTPVRRPEDEASTEVTPVQLPLPFLDRAFSWSVFEEERGNRELLEHEWHRSRLYCLLSIVPSWEEIQRYTLWNAHLRQCRQRHLSFVHHLNLLSFFDDERQVRAGIAGVAEQELRALRLRHEMLLLHLMWDCTRALLLRSWISEALELKADVLFTLFYESAVEQAEMEDAAFQNLTHQFLAESGRLRDRQRLYFGLKLSDGLILPGPNECSTKEMYYHLRVAESHPPARPLINQNDIIVAVEGVPVVTLSAMKKVLTLVRGQTAHFTIRRARDNVTTTVTVKGHFREETSKSRSPSHIGRI